MASSFITKENFFVATGTGISALTVGVHSANYTNSIQLKNQKRFEMAYKIKDKYDASKISQIEASKRLSLLRVNPEKMLAKDSFHDYEVLFDKASSNLISNPSRPFGSISISSSSRLKEIEENVFEYSASVNNKIRRNVEQPIYSVAVSEPSTAIGQANNKLSTLNAFPLLVFFGGLAGFFISKKLYKIIFTDRRPGKPAIFDLVDLANEVDPQLEKILKTQENILIILNQLDKKITVLEKKFPDIKVK